MELSREDKQHVQQLITDVADTYIARSLDHHDAEQVQGQIRVVVGPFLTSMGGSPWISTHLIAWLWADQTVPDSPLTELKPTSATGDTIEEAFEGIRKQLGISERDALDDYIRNQ